LPPNVHAAPRSGRALAAADVRLDVSAALGVLALWPRGAADSLAPVTSTKATRRAALRLATGPAYRTLRTFQSEQNRCFIQDREMQRALLYPDSLICGISLAPAFHARAALDSLLREVALRERALRAAMAADAGRYLPPRKAWKPIPVRFVISSQWSFDAVTLPDGGDGSPAVVVNATEVLNYAATPREQVDALQHVLAHETFHAGVQQMERSAPGWAGYGPRAISANAYIARVLLDEGVAHYVDWRTRPGSDTLFTRSPGTRERRAFTNLNLAAKRLGPGEDPGARIEILQLASTGPLWSKYGAISGMFVAYRIESRLGVDSLRAAVVGGPREFIRMYRGLAEADTALGRMPVEFSDVR
jgi:hypothetical protein